MIEFRSQRPGFFRFTFNLYYSDNSLIFVNLLFGLSFI
jgi:hypothetical protein